MYLPNLYVEKNWSIVLRRPAEQINNFNFGRNARETPRTAAKQAKLGKVEEGGENVSTFTKS